jgi:hypothetical protein
VSISKAALTCLFEQATRTCQGATVARSSGAKVSRCHPIIPVFTQANAGTSLAVSG